MHQPLIRPKTTSSQQLLFSKLVFICMVFTLPQPVLSAESGQSAIELEIIGTSRLGENKLNRWSAQLFRRATEFSADGYRPNSMAGQPLSSNPPLTEWEVPVDFYWDFGDGSPVFTTGERVTASHIYKNDGEFTLKVEARNINGQSVFASKQITVINKKPNLRSLKSVQLDAANASYEFTGRVLEAPDDVVHAEWDFGDGTQTEASQVWFTNNAWKVVHQFPQAGHYTITLRVTDEQGEFSEKSLELYSAGIIDSTQDLVSEVDPDMIAGAAQTNFTAKTSLSIDSDFSGQITPITGIYLSPIKQNEQCRFMFSAWDDAQLMNVSIFNDMPGLPELEGAKFTFHSPLVNLIFFADKAAYDLARNGLINAYTGSNLREKLAPATTLLSDKARQALTEHSGLDTTRESMEQQTHVATPQTSPFGLDKQQSFTSQTGELELTFIPYDRAVASFDLVMINTDQTSPYQSLSLKGDYGVNLATARAEGIMLYNQCEPAKFEIEKTYPVANSQHQSLSENYAQVRFNEDYDVATLNQQTFQLTYPSAGSGELVPVQTQLHRSSQSATLVPVEDLWGGVRYTVRVKTGEQGVRGKNGMPLEDEDGSGWISWDFTTRVKLIPQAGDDSNLSCHVYQSVRDVPLIAGKRAVSRIYANWQENPLVKSSAQLKEFTARVVIKNVKDNAWVEEGADFHRFVRPDLWPVYGIKMAEAEHTANVFWTPETATPDALLVAMEVPQQPGSSHAEAYWTQCATPMWGRQPELKVDYYILGINDWTDESLRDYYLPLVKDIMKVAKEYALQQYPFKQVHIRYAGTIERSELALDCNKQCARGFIMANHSSTADIIVGFMPILRDIEGGSTIHDVFEGNGPGAIVVTVDDLPERKDRWIFSVVHEFGHTLWLKHSPQVDLIERNFIVAMRENAWANGGYPIHWHRGIEGFRIDPAGNNGYNKSSIEGNAEHINPAIYTAGPWLEELMYPATLPYTQAFISRNNYLQIMEKLDAQSVAPTGRDD
ncbi:PKD domain-containing protein [Marinicella litoralis]|uniref:PKD domain-containing protein n=1 Tax=Marinicella litoralis TaxID=644220 RepID=A0A4R6XZ67_9GAMM|nr:PKD domain-containing protein [Marinicella litoralis]TDR23840.1 PKD domain-containing protein [Marinicella litoralis]